tara:strand:+ start:26401 stop:27012 length:612 start_codon:yes stop_codon:yes gene_type:complete
MGRAKKLLLAAGTLVLIGGGVFYYLNSKDHYDPSKYSATITAPEINSQKSASPIVERDAGAPTAAAIGLAKGMRVELTLPDQFDVSHTIAPEIETLIFAFSKGAGATVRGFLDKEEENFLAQHKAIFIADISPIPVVIRNTLALPKLRKSSYPVMLIYEEEMAASLRNDAHEDQIAVVTIQSYVVQDIRYLADEAGLASIFSR